MSPTLGELDGGLASPSEGPETPVGSGEGSGGSDVELLWEANKPEVPVVLPKDNDEAEVTPEVPDEFTGVRVVEVEAGSGVELTGGGFVTVEDSVWVALRTHA
jgi:hypothetical protein